MGIESGLKTFLRSPWADILCCYVIAAALFTICRLLSSPLPHCYSVLYIYCFCIRSVISSPWLSCLRYFSSEYNVCIPFLSAIFGVVRRSVRTLLPSQTRCFVKVCIDRYRDASKAPRLLAGYRRCRRYWHDLCISSHSYFPPL